MLIAFSGFKGSGKDTAANVLVEEYGFTKIAFADAVRQLALIIDPIITMQDGTVITNLTTVIKGIGWDKAKRKIPEVRRLLQVIGTEGGRMLVGENVWIDILAERFPDIADSSSRYVITDCRFPNEADFVESKNGSVVWISRPGLVPDGHASESDEIRRWRNWEIINDSDIESFKQSVRDMMTKEGVRPIE